MGRKGQRDRLNPTEKAFVEAYTAPDAPTTLNATQSYLRAFGGPYETARSNGYTVTKRPQVQRAMRELLNETDIADKVRDGLNKIVSGFLYEDKYRAKDFAEAARLITEIRGDKAPDKQVILNITPEQREAEYEEITNKVLKVQTKVPTQLVTGDKDAI
jgi:phage terminase small subunit